MTAPLSQDLRQRLVRAVEEGSSARAAAARFEVSASAAIRLVRRVRETGSTEPARIGGYRKPLLAGHEGLLRELTSTRKGITLVEIRDALVERGIAPGSLTTIWSTLRRLGLTHKKEPEGSRAGPAGRRHPSPTMAGLAAPHGPGLVRVPR
jgi:transposase